MFDLSAYNKPQIEVINFEPLGNINIKLMTVNEIDAMFNEKLDEQIALCIVNADGDRVLIGDKFEEFKAKVPFAHKKKLINEIMHINGVSVKIEELEKK